MILNSNCGTRGIINVEGLRMILICKSISTVNVNMKKKKKLGLSKTIQYLVILGGLSCMFIIYVQKTYHASDGKFMC